ncbi:hypothetical protein BKA62DRAFT_705323 [Auriculariales sp. MPI-PUGE-AT-0066]|nr:hypothetical protein BKA62DRAFT_705323 [Auriculariales sp. MPI-PUGE-AT-0066]
MGVKIIGCTTNVVNSIYPVLDAVLISADIAEFLELISKVNSSTVDYYERLDDCYITRVAHYRYNDYNHEIIILHMISCGAGNSEDTRYFKLERFRADAATRRRWNLFASVETSASSCSNFNPLDMVAVSDVLHRDEHGHGLVPAHYKLVRELELPRSTLTVLEALVVAKTLTDICKSYTIFVYTCQFWAINLFLLIKAIASSRAHPELLVLTNGLALQTAGTFHKLRLVDIETGRATAELLQASDKSLRALCKAKGAIFDFETIKCGRDQVSTLRLGGDLTTHQPTHAAADYTPVDDISTNKVYQTAQVELSDLKEKIRAACSPA